MTKTELDLRFDRERFEGRFTKPGWSGKARIFNQFRRSKWWRTRKAHPVHFFELFAKRHVEWMFGNRESRHQSCGTFPFDDDDDSRSGRTLHFMNPARRASWLLHILRGGISTSPRCASAHVALVESGAIRGTPRQTIARKNHGAGSVRSSYQVGTASRML